MNASESASQCSSELSKGDLMKRFGGSYIGRKPNAALLDEQLDDAASSCTGSCVNVVTFSLTISTLCASPILRGRFTCPVFSLVTALKRDDAPANRQTPPALCLLANLHEIALNDFS
jgi:hypothetical protein